MTLENNANPIEDYSSLPRDFIDAFGDEGDFARQYLLTPTLLAILGNVAGKRILDVGCGQGYLSRMLAKRSAQVVGIEPATPSFQYATERETAEPLGIEYIQADIAAFGEPLAPFDVAVANMVLMDIPDYRRALDTVFRLLRPGGSFMCSLSHPCFEESESDYRAKGYVAVAEYFAEYSIQQRWGYRHHRPLSHYFSALLERGAVVKAVIEPQLDPSHARYPIAEERDCHVPSFLVIHVIRTWSST